MITLLNHWFHRSNKDAVMQSTLYTSHVQFFFLYTQEFEFSDDKYPYNDKFAVIILYGMAFEVSGTKS